MVGNKYTNKVQTESSSRHLLTPMNTADTEAYFSALISHIGLQTITVKHIDDRLGKGMFAARNINVNEVLYTESRRFGITNEHSALPTCTTCSRVLGAFDDVWKLAEDYAHHHHHHHRDDENVHEWIAVCCPPFNDMCEELALDVNDLCCATPVECECGEVYCSNTCRQQAWDSHHQILCSANGSKMMSVFWQHVRETNETFSAAAHIIASIILSAIRAGGEQQELDSAMRHFRIFTSKPWHHVVQVPDDIDDEDVDNFYTSLIMLVEDTSALLSNALSPYSSRAVFTHLFTPEFFSQIVGMLELNNVGVASRSAMSIVHDSLVDDEIDVDIDARHRAIALLDEAQKSRLNEHAEIVSSGCGLYTLTSSINHSCEPNAVLLKPSGGMNGATTVVALRPLQQGEQIFVSYVDEAMSLVQRRRALADYGFVCVCVKCERECEK